MRQRGEGVIRKLVILVLTIGTLVSAVLIIDGKLAGPQSARVWLSGAVLPGMGLVTIRSEFSTLVVSTGDDFPPNDIIELPDFYVIGFWRSTQRLPTLTRVTYHIPIWMVFVLFAVYPTLAFCRGPLRRWHRCRKDRCLSCGYDITGNESGICPECGTPVSPRKKTQT